MSYDVSFYADLGAGEIKVLDNHRNYTYNVAPMFIEAFPTEEGIKYINGMRAIDAINHLGFAIWSMKTYRPTYEKMNPENGWGNYEGALKFLENILADCKEVPFAILRIS